MTTGDKPNHVEISVKDYKEEKFAPTLKRLVVTVNNSYLADSTDPAEKNADAAAQLDLLVKNSPDLIPSLAGISSLVLEGIPNSELTAALYAKAKELLPDLKEETINKAHGFTLEQFLETTAKTQIKSRYITSAPRTLDVLRKEGETIDLRVTINKGLYDFIIDRDLIKAGLTASELVSEIKDNATKFSYEIPDTLRGFIANNTRFSDVDNVRIRWERIANGEKYHVNIESIGNGRGTGKSYSVKHLVEQSGLDPKVITSITINHPNVELDGLRQLSKVKDISVTNAVITQRALDELVFDAANLNVFVRIPVAEKTVKGDQFKGGFKSGFVSLQSAPNSTDENKFTATLHDKLGSNIIKVDSDNLAYTIEKFDKMVGQSYGVKFSVEQASNAAVKKPGLLERLFGPKIAPVAAEPVVAASAQEVAAPVTVEPANIEPAKAVEETPIEKPAAKVDGSVGLGEAILSSAVIPSTEAIQPVKRTVGTRLSEALTIIRAPGKGVNGLGKALFGKDEVAAPAVETTETPPAAEVKPVQAEAPKANEPAKESVLGSVIRPKCPPVTTDITPRPTLKPVTVSPDAAADKGGATNDNVNTGEPVVTEETKKKLQELNRQVENTTKLVNGTTTILIAGVAMAVASFGTFIKMARSQNESNRALAGQVQQALKDAKTEAFDIATAATLITVEEETEKALKNDGVIDKEEVKQLLKNVNKYGLQKAASYVETEEQAEQAQRTR